MKSDKAPGLHLVAGLIAAFSFITAAAGLFYKTGGKARLFLNQYGDSVKICGEGLYAHDSYFKAPIFRGTDCTILFAAIPLLILALVLDLKRMTLKSRLFLTSVICVFAYYSASIAFGVTYNFMCLAYIALFCLSLFGLILAAAGIDTARLAAGLRNAPPKTGEYVFLLLVGTALIAAWLPDIAASLMNHRSLALIEVYTTEITYVLDMGIVAPAAFVCVYLLKKRSGAGCLLLTMLLTLGSVVGVMVPVQTVFQISAGIRIPAGALMTKSGSFALLALLAVWLQARRFRSMREM